MNELEISINEKFNNSFFNITNDNGVHMKMYLQNDDFQSMITDYQKFISDICSEKFDIETLSQTTSDNNTLMQMDKDIELCIEYSNMFYEEFKKILDKFEYVKLDFESNNDIIKFLNNNPELSTKKIVKGCKYTINDIEKIKKDVNELNEYKDHLYFELDGNRTYVNLGTCLKTIEVIDKEAQEIANINLSPLETIAYVYDYVRNRVYNPEKDNNIYSSRNLSSVLFGKNIVCVGYTAHFNAILKRLGFRCYDISLRSHDNSSGHRRSGIYVEDPKYNINGFYYFDPTFDSKKEEDDISYLQSYKYFAKTKRQIDNPGRIELGLTKYYEYLISQDNLEKLVDDLHFCNITELNEYEQTGQNIIKYTSNMPTEIMSNEKLFDILRDSINKFDNKIPIKTLLLLIINVRLKEFEINPEYYPLSVDEFYNIFINSGWKTNIMDLDKAIILLYQIFGSLPKELIDSGQVMFEKDFYALIEEFEIEDIINKHKYVINHTRKVKRRNINE